MKINQGLGVLKRLAIRLPKNVLRPMVHGLVYGMATYGLLSMATSGSQNRLFQPHK